MRSKFRLLSSGGTSMNDGAGGFARKPSRYAPISGSSAMVPLRCCWGIGHNGPSGVKPWSPGATRPIPVRRRCFDGRARPR